MRVGSRETINERRTFIVHSKVTYFTKKAANEKKDLLEVLPSWRFSSVCCVNKLVELLATFGADELNWSTRYVCLVSDR